MLQRIGATQPLLGIETQELFQQVDRLLGSFGENGAEGYPEVYWQTVNISLSTRRSNALQSCVCRRSQSLQDLVKLIDIAEKAMIKAILPSRNVDSLATFENGLAPEALCQDAPNRPDIDCMPKFSLS